ALAFGAVIGGFVVIDAYGGDEDDAKRTFKRWMLFGGGVLVFSFLLASLLPSSKTAAAMIVLPAITSDTVVQTVAPEARELYELAKDALRSVAKDKPAKEAEAK